MLIITTKSDLKTYVGNVNPANILSEGSTAVDATVDALASADGAPLYGQDWSDWLDEHAERIAIASIDHLP